MLRVAIVLAVGIASAWLIVVVLTFRTCLGESNYAKPGSFTYYACVSSVMQNVPRVGAIGEVIFYTSAGDGPKPAMDEVSYRSRLAAHTVMSETGKYLESAGFVRADVGQTSSSASFSGPEGTVDVKIRSLATDEVQVQVTQTFH
jgi:hypothetical protein